MSLFSTIRMAGNSLMANEIALQVVGQNITNANTPGYIREEVELGTAGTQKVGSLLLGLGVTVDAVVQKIDKYLEQRLNNASSDSASAQTVADTYTQLEGLIGELGDSDLSTSLNEFFGSIADILNQPDDLSVRTLAVSQGQTLADNITRLAQQAEELYAEINQRIENMAGDINRLTQTIADLNVKISAAEGGGVSNSEAGGLRDQRYTALAELAKLINVNAVEQSDGTVTVYCGSQYLVYAGTSRSVEAAPDADSAAGNVEIRLVENNAKLESASGELGGLIDARDNVLGGFLDKLNDFVQTLIYEFNKVYSSGQGLSGYTTLTSENGVDDASQSLADAGLPFTPESGSFQVFVHNTKTGLTTTTDITVDLNGSGHDTTLDDLKTMLDDIEGISAEITSSGRLKIDSETSDVEFAFADDTSGALAALGLNIFFTGASADDIGVSEYVINDPATFAASSGGIGADTNNAVILADFIDQPIESRSGVTLGDLYTSMIAEVTQNSASAQASATAAQTFADSLAAQKSSVSGVNLDEEAVKMLAYQNAYRASAKLIAALAELFDILVEL
jgi:flagellar hook-associated protein 1 FlgK